MTDQEPTEIRNLDRYGNTPPASSQSPTTAEPPPSATPPASQPMDISEKHSF